jgi:opacity protein-like surface antigen
MLSPLLDFTPVDVRLSAFYGEGGVRLLGPSDSVVRPYAEATVGLARLKTGFTGAGARNDALINTALLFLDTTRPMLGAGGGLMIQGGPVLVDLGYRYNKITAGNAIQSVLAGGDLSVHQVRVGVGVRF